MHHRAPIHLGYLRPSDGTVPKPSTGAGVMVTLSSARPGAIFGGGCGAGGASGVPEVEVFGSRWSGTDEIGADAMGGGVAGPASRTMNTTNAMPAPITVQRNSRS